MERKIKFRAKHITNGAWLYGDLLQTNEGSVCIGVHGQYIDDGMHFNDMYDETPYIDEDTIGQFTGLLDKNGKEIYEGDIVKAPLLDPIFGDILSDAFDNAPIEFSNGSFVVSYYNGNHKIYIQDLYDKIEVISNIHDNPSLISDKR